MWGFYLDGEKPVKDFNARRQLTNLWESLAARGESTITNDLFRACFVRKKQRLRGLIVNERKLNLILSCKLY